MEASVIVVTVGSVGGGAEARIGPSCGIIPALARFLGKVGAFVPARGSPQAAAAGFVIRGGTGRKFAIGRV
jgi:hypothetical protein